MASTSLSQTAGTPTNQNTGTLSFWMKLGNIGVNNEKLYHTSGGSDSNTFTLQFQGTTDRLMIANNGGVLLILNRVLRDTSAWYHIVCVSDPSNATANQRLRIYINGVEETSMATDNRSSVGTSSVGISVNSQIRYISGNGSQDYFDGYMAEYYFIDGQALSPTDFGQTDSTGIWKPKGYSGTYGTNGFYLKFSNSGDLGADSSGNGNNFTKSGNGRQRTDTPSNVFATINSLANYYNPSTLSQGNLRVDFASGVDTVFNISTIGVSTGKWYCEIDAVTIPGYAKIGIASRPCIAGGNSDNLSAGQYNYGYSASNGNVDSNNTAGGDGGTYVGYGATWTSGDIIGIGLDLDNNRLYFSKNGTWQNSADPSAGTGGVVIADPTLTQDGAYYFAVGDNRNDFATRMDCNFGNPITTISSGNTDDNGYGNFEYTPPSGYLALCTKNLTTEAAPTIDDGSEYFNTVLYTGNSNTQSITGVGFQPDWTWIKSRSNASWHALQDSSRGSLKTLFSNQSDSEATYTDSVTSFDSDGFSMGDDSEGGSINVSSRTYVAWNWKANGGTTSSNSDGTITSTVQANTTTGLSIVTYTGNGTAGATVGHGLGVKPSWFVVKGRSLAGSWVNYHTSLGATKGIPLQGTSAAVTTSAYWNNTEPTSSVITLGYDGPGNEVNNSGSTFVAYCFAEIEGYSKFSSYIGNGSTDGTFIYTGFKPAFVIIKRTDSTGQWTLIDTTRQDYNLNDRRFHPNLPDVEYSGDGYGWDMLSNGFKQRSTSTEFNGSGASFIYIAFAENPFVTSGGLPVTAR